MSKVYTIQEACEELRVSRSFFYTLLRTGRIPTLRFGRLVRITAEDLDDYKAKSVQQWRTR